MTPSHRPPYDAGHHQTGDLAGLAPSLRAQFRPVDDGFQVEIEPLSIVEAFSLWPELSLTSASTMLIAIDDRGDDVPAALFDNRFNDDTPVERIDGTAVTVPAAHLADLAVVTPADTLVAVAIDGPVEPTDAEAIRRATRVGLGVLAAEMRAVVAVTAIGDRALRIESRDPELAAAFVGEGLRQYAARRLHRWPLEIGRPEPSLVLRVLERTGSLSVRPIETEIYPTSVDVGLGTHEDGAASPAQTSLIYDVCSATWHGE